MSTTLEESTARTGPTDPVGTDLIHTVKALKLGGLAHTLPERLALARQAKMGHAAFLQLLLSRRGHPSRVPLSEPAGRQGRTGPDHAAGHLGRAGRPHL